MLINIIAINYSEEIFLLISALCNFLLDNEAKTKIHCFIVYVTSSMQISLIFYVKNDLTFLGISPDKINKLLLPPHLF